MKTVIMICGLGSAGKSTTAKYLKENYFKDSILCRVDEFSSNHKISFQKALSLWIDKVKKSFIENDIIILDYSFDTIYCRKEYLDIFNFPKDINFICLYLNTSPSKIIEHNFKRNPKYEINEYKVDVINRRYKAQEFPKKDEFKRFYNNKIFIIQDNDLTEFLNYLNCQK